MTIRGKRFALVLAAGAMAAAALPGPAVASGLLGTVTDAVAQPASFAKDSVLVKYKDGASSSQLSFAQQIAGVLGVVAPIAGTGALEVRVAGDPRVAVERLNRSSAVEYAELNTILTADATCPGSTATCPNDPEFAKLYGLHNNGQTGGTADADIDAPEGWGAAGMAGFPASGGAKVGIVDTGIQQNHPDLSGKVANCGGVKNFGVSLVVVSFGSDPTIVDGKCEDDHGHGTHVAGTIAAKANNGTGVTGVAFNSPLAICKALNSAGSGTLAMVANCITYLAQQNVKIISMSLGGSSGSTTLKEAVVNATNKGILVIAAAGNGGNSAPNYPAYYPEVVSVAAVDHNGQRASFSTYNDDVEVAAPGVDVLSTWTSGGYRSISGTSMATPHAAGVAAVIATLNPGAGPAGWRSILTSSTDSDGARSPQLGFGRVNLAKAAS